MWNACICGDVLGACVFGLVCCGGCIGGYLVYVCMSQVFGDVSGWCIYICVFGSVCLYVCVCVCCVCFGCGMFICVCVCVEYNLLGHLFVRHIPGAILYP